MFKGCAERDGCSACKVVVAVVSGAKSSSCNSWFAMRPAAYSAYQGTARSKRLKRRTTSSGYRMITATVTMQVNKIATSKILGNHAMAQQSHIKHHADQEVRHAFNIGCKEACNRHHGACNFSIYCIKEGCWPLCVGSCNVGNGGIVRSKGTTA